MDVKRILTSFIGTVILDSGVVFACLGYVQKVDYLPLASGREAQLQLMDKVPTRKRKHSVMTFMVF